MRVWVQKLRKFAGLDEPLDDVASLDDCEFSDLVEDPPKASAVLEYFSRIRSYVEHEDNLISSRLTWSLTVHGFLFATYGILLGKIGDEFGQIGNASTPLPEHLVCALFFLQLPISGFGLVVGHQSHNAICAAHNALMHLRAISKASRNLNIQHLGIKVQREILKADMSIELDSVQGIQQGSRLLVGHISDECKEIVTVADVQGKKVLAYFKKAHPANTTIHPLASFLLPSITGGRSSEHHVRGARSYYLNLPLWAMFVWLLLFSLSLGGFTSSLCNPHWFFHTFLGAPEPKSPLKQRFPVDLVAIQQNRVNAASVPDIRRGVAVKH